MGYGQGYGKNHLYRRDGQGRDTYNRDTYGSQNGAYNRQGNQAQQVGYQDGVMTVAPIDEQCTVLGQLSSRLTSTPITTTVPLTATGSSTRTCTARHTSRVIKRGITAELPTVVVKNYAGIGVALFRRAEFRLLLSSPRR